ncbi:hypothetical protein C8R42DRAFT_685437 [Lentinula raphanica]|nr:hypothetical protein C8R42DRAFT_685437 [Lentinula raphanica]
MIYCSSVLSSIIIPVLVNSFPSTGLACILIAWFLWTPSLSTLHPLTLASFKFTLLTPDPRIYLDIRTRDELLLLDKSVKAGRRLINCDFFLSPTSAYQPHC